MYRATVDVEKMRPFPELAWILEKHNLNLWYDKSTPGHQPDSYVGELTVTFRIGEDRHVMTYSIAGGRSFNMVLSHRDKGGPALFGMEEDTLGDMRREFAGWDTQ